MTKEINVHFAKDKLGKNGRIIGRDDDGKICIIDRGYRGIYPGHGEDWTCSVVEELQTKFIVTPIELKRTSGANSFNFNNKLEELKKRYAG